MAETTHDGQPVVVRFDARYRRDSQTRENRPIRIGVALPFTEQFGPRDRPQLDAIEDTIERAAADRVVLVLVLTTPQMRELVFHATSGDWIPQFHQDLRHSLPSYDVQMMAEEDRDWSVYFQFAGRS